MRPQWSGTQTVSDWHTWIRNSSRYRNHKWVRNKRSIACTTCGHRSWYCCLRFWAFFFCSQQYYSNQCFTIKTHIKYGVIICKNESAISNSNSYYLEKSQKNNGFSNSGARSVFSSETLLLISSEVNKRSKTNGTVNQKLERVTFTVDKWCLTDDFDTS